MAVLIVREFKCQSYAFFQVYWLFSLSQYVWHIEEACADNVRKWAQAT